MGIAEGMEAAVAAVMAALATEALVIGSAGALTTILHSTIFLKITTT